MLRFQKIILVLVIFVGALSSHSQQAVPKIGDYIGDVVLDDIQHYQKKKVSLAEFKGKWVLLDLWSVGCAGCIRAFPKVNEIQQDFEQDLTIVLVGKKDPRIKQVYEKHRIHYNLKLISAYDSAIFKLFEVTYVPRYFVIDPAGNFAGDVQPAQVNSHFLQRIIRGEVFASDKAEFKSSTENATVPFSGLRQSKLTYASEEYSTYTPSFEWPYHWSLYHKQGLWFNRVDAISLFQTAFFGKDFFMPGESGWYGKYWPGAVLDGIDSTVIPIRFSAKRLLYDYSLFVADSSVDSDYLQQMMQADINNCFPFVGSVEWRQMPYLRLTVQPGKKDQLVTKGGSQYIPSPGESSAGFEMRNVSLNDLLFMVCNFHQREMPIIDETGLSDFIDVKVDAILTDINSTIAGLQKAGFNVELAKKGMFTLVFRPRAHYKSLTTTNSLPAIK